MAAAPLASTDPAIYHAWYATPRGARIAGKELALLARLLRPRPGEALLDVGCGTGWFSSRFADLGLRVTGIDPDPAALAFARRRDGRVRYLQGRAEALPFADGAFDRVAAVTSLCFVEDPRGALGELWRVSRCPVVLGLLHRRSLLWRIKRDTGGYRGARWDQLREVRRWAVGLEPAPEIEAGWTLFLPGAGSVARGLDAILPSRLPLGGFLAVCLSRPGRDPVAGTPRRMAHGSFPAIKWPRFH